MCSLFRKFVATSAAAVPLAMPMTAHAAAERFTDVRPGAWYYDAVDYTTDEGLFNGTSLSTFDPEGSMAREQIAKILYDYAQRTGNDTSTLMSPSSGAP